MAKLKTLADFGGDQTAYDKYLQDNAGSANASTGQVAPKRNRIKGLILGISDKAIKFQNGNFGRFLTVAGESAQILISEALFQSNANYLRKGMEVDVEVEERIGGTTGYIDSNKSNKTAGQWVLHNSSGLGFVRVVLTEGEAQKIAAQEDVRLSLENKYGAREQSIGKVIDKVSTAIGDNKEALGVALAGAFNALRD